MLTLLRSSIVYNQSFDATIRNHTSIDATHAIAVTSSSVTLVAASRRRFDGDLSTSIVCCCLTTTRLAVASKLVITRSCGRPRPAAEVQRLQRRDHPASKGSGGHMFIPGLKHFFSTTVIYHRFRCIFYNSLHGFLGLFTLGLLLSI